MCPRHANASQNVDHSIGSGADARQWGIGRLEGEVIPQIEDSGYDRVFDSRIEEE